MSHIHKIQYYETDKMGIVHHSNYLRFFEEARTWYLEKEGLGYDVIESLGLIVPVIHAECDYTVSCTYGDTIDVDIKLTYFNGLKFTFEYVITSGNNSIVHARGKTEHCFLDSNFKPTLVKKTCPNIYEYMVNIANNKEEN